MYEKALEEAGLTRNESLAYLALLKLGKAKSGAVVTEAGISGGKVYETLYKLMEKGLVKATEENGVKHFFANHPTTVLQYLQERREEIETKEKELRDALPGMAQLMHQHDKLETVSLLKGLRGVSSLVYDVLPNAKHVIVMGVRSKKDASFNRFWKHWHAERGRLKIPARVLFSEPDSEYSRTLTGTPHTQTRRVSGVSPASVMLVDNHCFIFAYEDDMQCIHILSEPIARSFLSFFESMWTVAKR